MGEKTGIAWVRSSLLPEALATFQLALVADAVGLVVPQLVARMAKRHAVAHVVGEFRVRSNRLLMVRPQVAAVIVPAVSAFIAVARKDGLPPYEVFRLPAQTQIARGSAATIGVMLGTPRGTLPCNRGDQGARFRGVLLAKPAEIAFTRATESRARRWRVGAALEKGRSARLEPMVPVRSAPTRIADLSNAIDPGRILRELVSRSPFLASSTPVMAAGDALLISGNSKSSRMSRQLQPAFFGLSHG